MSSKLLLISIDSTTTIHLKGSVKGPISPYREQYSKVIQLINAGYIVNHVHPETREKMRADLINTKEGECPWDIQKKADESAKSVKEAAEKQKAAALAEEKKATVEKQVQQKEKAEHAKAQQTAQNNVKRETNKNNQQNKQQRSNNVSPATPTESR